MGRVIDNMNYAGNQPGTEYLLDPDTCPHETHYELCGICNPPKKWILVCMKNSLTGKFRFYRSLMPTKELARQEAFRSLTCPELFTIHSTTRITLEK